MAAASDATAAIASAAASAVDAFGIGGGPLRVAASINGSGTVAADGMLSRLAIADLYGNGHGAGAAPYCAAAAGDADTGIDTDDDVTLGSPVSTIAGGRLTASI